MKGFEPFCHNAMEQEKKQVPDNAEEQNVIRQYLLGTLGDEEKMREIEENLLVDDDFAESLATAENELVEDYLDGRLSESENKRFAEFFLFSEYGKQKLRLTQNLRKYATQSKTQSTNETSEKKVGFWDWLFLPAIVHFAVLILLVLGVGFAGWRIFLYQSNEEKGLAYLRAAYRGQRLIESRTTAGFDYAPLINTRSTEPVSAADEKARSQAAILLIEASNDSQSSESHHALGLLCLTEKKFDLALKEFNLALTFAPNDARLRSDTGAAYLEKASLAASDGKGHEFLENANSALSHLDTALKLDGNLLEALFNRALILQKMHLPGQAREAWAKYLEKDSTSPWAEEARRNLQELDSQKSQNLSADELERAFLNAFRRKNPIEANQLISQNRELVKEKYLPQKLAMSFVDASSTEKEEYLQALIYTGQLEEKNIGDSFAKDLAIYYTELSGSDLESIKQAHIFVRKSYQLCLSGKYKNSAEEARRAREIFLRVGNIYEARLSEFLVVYCLIWSNQIRESIPLAEQLMNSSSEESYKWLLSNTLYWLAAAYRTTGDRGKAKSNYKKCLTLAEEIEDDQVLQKILISFAKQNNFVGLRKESLNFLQQAFEKGGRATELSLREKWRTYSDGVELLATNNLNSLAKAVSLENLQLAKGLEETFFFYSQLDAGIVHMRSGDFEESRSLLHEVEQNAETKTEGAEQIELLGKSFLTLAALEIKLNNYLQAANFYDEALRVVGKSEYPFFLYQIQKGRLLTNISLNNEAQIEEEITNTINLAETYREKISEEQERSSFFNDQQDIYDIAIAENFKRGRYEQAYNYLENSNSRSLLDWIKKGVNVKEEKKKIEITFNENTTPLQLNEIQSQMPEQVQILQYAILENKILIWLVTKNNIAVVSSEISSEKLNEKVAAYTKLVSSISGRNQEESKKLAHELYEILLAPIISKLDPEREICLIPHKILFHLPFAALNAPDGTAFISQFNFFYSPSANVFLLSTENARRKSSLTTESLLSVGNPRFDREEFKELANLPEAENEALEIKQFYPVKQSLIGQEATKTAVQDNIGNVEIIHFAGHYQVKHGEPLFSGLLLTRTTSGADPENGILTNAELTGLQLARAKLVVLSACETGVEQYYNGEGLVGLSRTFLAAGAPLVVASQWKVDSEATSKLMKRFHFFRRQEKLSTSAALRRAQLEMAESTDIRVNQPYFWAAFATYGGYAEF